MTIDQLDSRTSSKNDALGFDDKELLERIADVKSHGFGEVAFLIKNGVVKEIHSSISERKIKI